LTGTSADVSLAISNLLERRRMIELNYEGMAFSFRGPSALLDCVRRVADQEHGPTPQRAALDTTGAQPDPSGKTTAPVPVACEVHEPREPAPLLETPRERGWLNWEWKADEARVSTLSARARVWRSGTGYAVEAWFAPDHRATRTLLGALYSAVLHDLGGFILHSASVLSGGGVVAFVGPSGAGKSTACRHMQEEPTFSIDRIAILPRHCESTSGSETPPRSRTWYAYPLYGGTSIDPDKPRVAPRWSPLRAVLRVQHAKGEARLEACSAAAAVALLRESVFHGGPGVKVEQEVLERLEHLASAVPVGRVHFGLGPSLTPAVGRWLSQ
jgi:hypothetical protein